MNYYFYFYILNEGEDSSAKSNNQIKYNNSLIFI